MDPSTEQQHADLRVRASEPPTPRERTVEWIAGVLLVLGAAVAAVVTRASIPDLTLVAILLVLYVACWQITFEFGPASTTPVQLVSVPMWFAVDPALLPLLVVTAQVLGNVVASLLARERHHWRRVLIGVPDAWYAVGPAMVLLAFGVSEPSLDLWPILALALAAQFAVDTALLFARTWGAIGLSPAQQAPGVLWMSMVDLALAPIGLLAALAVWRSPLVLLALLPLVGLLTQFAKERDDRIRKALELSHAYQGTARLMGDVLEADDAYTGGEHTQGVVELSLAVGSALGLDSTQMRDLEFGALLHDIGKLRVPNEIINKPGKLDEEEWAVIRQHPRYGQEMLDRVGGALGDAGLIVRAHHERWDGGGYPDGLLAEAIPVEARIIAACDSFSAMTTDRSYRRGMPHDEALEELERCSGTQFDPTVVGILRRILSERPAPSALRLAPEPELRMAS